MNIAGSPNSVKRWEASQEKNFIERSRLLKDFNGSLVRYRRRNLKRLPNDMSSTLMSFSDLLSGERRRIPQQRSYSCSLPTTPPLPSSSSVVNVSSGGCSGGRKCYILCEVSFKQRYQQVWLSPLVSSKKRSIKSTNEQFMLKKRQSASQPTTQIIFNQRNYEHG